MFALVFVWLSAVDLDIINQIAKARSGVEVTYMTIQFLSTLPTFLILVLMISPDVCASTKSVDVLTAVLLGTRKPPTGPNINNYVKVNDVLLI
jgi:hypothetical protein